jgi:hypothetical protein
MQMDQFQAFIHIPHIRCRLIATSPTCLLSCCFFSVPSFLSQSLPCVAFSFSIINHHYSLARATHHCFGWSSGCSALPKAPPTPSSGGSTRDKPIIIIYYYYYSYRNVSAFNKPTLNMICGELLQHTAVASSLSLYNHHRFYVRFQH